MRKKTVPAGATVVVAPWLIHRHRDLWPEPDAFNPDRYDGDASRDALKQAYLPFGMGPRVCMGAAFALRPADLMSSQRWHAECARPHWDTLTPLLERLRRMG